MYFTILVASVVVWVPVCTGNELVEEEVCTRRHCYIEFNMLYIMYIMRYGVPCLDYTCTGTGTGL